MTTTEAAPEEGAAPSRRGKRRWQWLAAGIGLFTLVSWYVHRPDDVRTPNDPAFVAQEKALAQAQSEAMAIVRAEPGITGVRWELDVAWLRAHAIDVPENALTRH